MNTLRSARRRAGAMGMAGLVGGLLACGLLAARAQDLDKRLLDAENKRIAAIEKVKPAVVAIFAKGGGGGGSGVLIDEEGYALTNFHVTNGAGIVMQCGLADGVLYDGVLVGLDKVGDVALIKLLPPKDKPNFKFPYAKMGDSDKVKAGDQSLAMGNPFLLATDFTPTVTFGLVSGVHRYQYPAGTLLEYTDCIQIDTSINPGNSGGPLFNMDGEIIGINGRGSFEKRGRVNSGVGYAISINQIKNFLPQLRAGMDTDHASVGAGIESDTEEGALGKLLVKSMIECDAMRRGLEIGDELVGFGKVPRLASVNEFKNVLGLYPRGWRVPLTYRRNNEKREILVRLMGVQKQEIAGSPDGGPMPPPGPRPGPAPVKHPLYEAKKGFANYHFNKTERERLLKEFHKHGDFTGLAGDTTIKCQGTIKGKPNVTAEFTIKEKGAKDKANDLIASRVDGIEYSVVPLDPNVPLVDLLDPPGSAGFAVALYHYRQLLVHGEKAFVGEFSHGGMEPWYLPPPEKDKPDYDKLRVDCEVIRTQHAGLHAKWYFSLKDDATKEQLIGCEILVDKEKDPCEVHFMNYQKVEGRLQPTRLVVRVGDKTYADFTTTSLTFTK
jgi:serine protease Do